VGVAISWCMWQDGAEHPHETTQLDFILYENV